MNNITLNEGAQINIGQNQYIIVQEIGQGSFGKVYEALNHLNQKVAIKLIDLKTLKSQENGQLYLKYFYQEIEIQPKIQSMNVVKLLDFFQDQDQAFMVLEYCNQRDLKHFIKIERQNNKLSEDEAISIFRQLLNGFKALHEQKIIHRDIKLQNILMNDGMIKIADFGFARVLHEMELSNSRVGTPMTRAPEINQGKKYSIKADLFSLGVVFYQILFDGEYPYSYGQEDQLEKQKKEGKINFQLFGKKYSQNLIDIIKQMLEAEPSKRLDWSELYKKDIFKEKEQTIICVAQMEQTQIYDTRINKDAKKNQEFYEKINEQENQNKQNQFLQDQENQFNIEDSLIKYNKNRIIYHQIKQQDYEQIKNQAENQEKQTEFLKKLYFNELCILTITGQAVMQIYKLPKNTIVVQYPVVFLLKKLIIDLSQFLQSIKQKKKLFEKQVIYPPNFFDSEYIEKIISTVEDQIEIGLRYFDQSCEDAKEFLKSNPNNINLPSQMNLENNQTFHNLYKRILLKYIGSLQKEVNNKIQEKYIKQIEEANIFSIHSICVAECIDLDKSFRKIAIFDFKTNYQQINQKDIQQRMNYLQQLISQYK